MVTNEVYAAAVEQQSKLAAELVQANERNERNEQLLAALRDLGEFASRSRETYAHTKEWTSLPAGSCETIRVPVALLNRIRDAALAAAESA